MRQTLEAFWALMAWVEELAEPAWAQQPVAQIKLIARTALPDFIMFSPDELNSRCAHYSFIQSMSNLPTSTIWMPNLARCLRERMSSTIPREVLESAL
jgi:hypothetical protein